MQAQSEQFKLFCRLANPTLAGAINHFDGAYKANKMCQTMSFHLFLWCFNTVYTITFEQDCQFANVLFSGAYPKEGGRGFPGHDYKMAFIGVYSGIYLIDVLFNSTANNTIPKTKKLYY